jgi:hypothetical protein
VQQQAERVGRLALQLREPAVAREPGSVADAATERGVVGVLIRRNRRREDPVGTQAPDDAGQLDRDLGGGSEMSVPSESEKFHAGSENPRRVPGLVLTVLRSAVRGGLTAGADHEGKVRAGLCLAGEDAASAELQIVRMRPEGQQPAWLRRGTQSRLRRNGR